MSDADVDERPVLELPQELEVVKTHIETLLSELGEGEMMTSAEIRDAVLGPGAPWKLMARRAPKANLIMRALLIDWPQAWEAGGALPDSPLSTGQALHLCDRVVRKVQQVRAVMLRLGLGLGLRLCASRVCRRKGLDPVQHVCDARALEGLADC